MATEPVDFRKGIDGLATVCRRVLSDNPLSGALYVFRNRTGTTLKILCYDGQGFWLCTKRLSQDRFTWWPTTQDTSTRLSARELAIVLWNGNPQQAGMVDDWKKLPKAGPGACGNSMAAKLLGHGRPQATARSGMSSVSLGINGRRRSCFIWRRGRNA